MYQVLYRKYRPKVFADVYGQDHVTSTLKNEIKEGRISHAYLFTGSRGTGKTTCAKILAKAVNCEHNRDGEPCNECEVCKGLDSGTIYDVVEIDAASNNGVDNIRDLREEANYTPSRGRYRVYIIDEVHMLSTGAYNALLKTLEEPPPHVIFILATTEVHKIPATVLSRCQRFDFRRIPPEVMAVRLGEVARLEGLKLTDDAAVLIARIADGALRDGLSVLDQCSCRSREIDSALVSEVAGLAGREAMYRLADCISVRDSSAAMEEISRLYQNSFDMERLCVEMINHFRNYLIVKTVKKSRELIICTDDEYNTICESARAFTLESVIYALDLFQDTLTKIKSGASARIELEMTFIKLCEPKLDVTDAAVLERLSQLERAVKRGIPAAQSTDLSAQRHTQGAPEPEPDVDADTNTNINTDTDADTPTVSEPDVSARKVADGGVDDTAASGEYNNFDAPPGQPVGDMQETFIPPTEQAEPTTEQSQAPLQSEKATAETAQDSNAQTVFDGWEDFMDVIHKNAIALYGVLSGARGYIRGDYFLIESSNPSVREFLKIPTSAKAIKQALYEVTGKNYKLGIFKNRTDAPQQSDPLEDLISRAKNNIKINFE